MAKILRDFFFKITAIIPAPAASTSFLRQVCVVVKPKDGVTTDVPTLCVSMSAVAALTDNVDAQGLFDAGMTRVYILPSANLSIASKLLSGEFFTLLISSDFTDANVTGADFGAFAGVVGVSSTDDTFLAVQAAIPRRSAFHTTSVNKCRNMAFAFGKFLSAVSWANQQYISLPVADDIDTIGEAENLFDDRISFAITDDEYSTRLGFFVAGGDAIIAPYVTKNLEIDLQSAAFTFVTANQPTYTKVNAALLQDELDKILKNRYIDTGLIEAGEISVDLIQSNFIANADMKITKPNALWRLIGEMSQDT